MNNKLNKIYQNNLIGPLKNSKVVYSSLNKNESNIKKNYDIENKVDSHWTIKQKISNIFNSNNYIYKADVTIITNSKTMKKRIVGRNNNYLFTMDNEYIKISDIIDIY